MRAARARSGAGLVSACVSLVLVLIILEAAPASGQQGDPARTPRPAPAAFPEVEPLTFAGDGHTFHGDWHADVTLSRDGWHAGVPIRVDVAFRFADTHLAGLVAAGIKADKLCLLVTAERTFDADGWMRLPSDERMSTLLTPTGLAIEGGVQGAVTNRYGYQFRSPFDQFQSIPANQTEPGDAAGTRLARFSVSAALPANLPPGLYRLRLDFGVMVGTRLYNFNGFTFASRISSDQAGTSTLFYSPVVPASGVHASGRGVVATHIQARTPWLLLANYNSNGYRGVVADEDRHHFATSDRSLIPDEVVLPMYDNGGNRLSYSLEPQFPADTIDALQNLPWDWTNGEVTVRVTGPDGGQVDVGTGRFVAKSGNGPTTKLAAFTGWKPPLYGRYTVTSTGWIADRAGRRYEGGGTYRFWIGKRMTLATATFQGMPYPVGSSYGRDIQFNPAVPADVQVTASLYVNSDVTNVRSVSYSGKASPAGLFGAAQGMKSFPLDAPGEYHATVLATYTDAEGHLWVCPMRHAGVVYPESSPVVARGKKLSIGGKYVDRGEKKFEGRVDADGTQHLDHITFPYLAGDMLLIAAEGQGANKVEPVLTYQMAGDTSPWDTTLNGVGTTNLRIKTSNGYSPHLYPEYITDIEYYYGAAPRPGFMGRFLVGESIVRAPYWPVSPNSFGGQIGASANGDTPGDIYRLLGGVVLQRVGKEPMYAGYIASAFLLAKGTNNNRVVAPGSEDLNGPLGDRARFFLVGLRPGTAYEVGSSFRPVAQIDPLLPVSIRFVLTYPDGHQLVANGTGDKYGSFAGPTAWTLDAPGVYRYQMAATWDGFEGRMPGLPDNGGVFFVYSKTRPAGAAGLRIDGASQRTFSAATGTTITGTSGGTTVHYALITPGAVIDVGEVPVQGGKFRYVFDPAAVHAKVPLYDVVSITTGKPQIGRVIHLTFFSEEKTAAGPTFFDVTRIILRGTTAIAARAAVPPQITSLPAGVDGALGAAAAGVPTRVAATDPAELRAWDANVDRLVREGDLLLVADEQDTVLAGRRHERLQQLYRGVPVFGGQVTRQFERGLATSIFGTLHRRIDLDPMPAVTADAAQAVVERQGGGQVAPARPPALVVLPLDGGGYALAWQVEARSGTDVRISFVDTTDGTVILDYSNLQTHPAATGNEVAARRAGTSPRQAPVPAPEASRDARRPGSVTTYDLRGDLARTTGVLSGRVALGPADLAPADGAALHDPVAGDATAHVAATRDVFLQRFGRRGLDGRDRPIAVVVHPVKVEDWSRLQSRYRLFFAGAFWDGRALVFGEGLPPGATVDGRTWAHASAALDLVAHEFAHGVIGYTSGLIYRNESGALNEAFADIMATAVESAVQPAGPGRSKADYLVGEDAVSGGGLRSLADPAVHGHPDSYERRVTGPADNGGVHANSTIVSHVYYLAVEGGTNRTSGLAVGGVGRERREQIEKAFYRAFVYMLPSDATFADARAATIQSARDLYGAGSAAEPAITAAWIAAGVK